MLTWLRIGLVAVVLAWATFCAIRYLVAAAVYHTDPPRSISALVLGLASFCALLLNVPLLLLALALVHPSRISVPRVLKLERALLPRRIRVPLLGLRLLVHVLAALSSLLLLAAPVLNLVLVNVWRTPASLADEHTIRGRCHWDVDILWSGTGQACATGGDAAGHASSSPSPSFGAWLSAAISRLCVTLLVLASYHLALLFHVPAAPPPPAPGERITASQSALNMMLSSQNTTTTTSMYNYASSSGVLPMSAAATAAATAAVTTNGGDDDDPCTQYQYQYQYQYHHYPPSLTLLHSSQSASDRSLGSSSASMSSSRRGGNGSEGSTRTGASARRPAAALLADARSISDDELQRRSLSFTMAGQVLSRIEGPPPPTESESESGSEEAEEEEGSANELAIERSVYPPLQTTTRRSESSDGCTRQPDRDAVHDVYTSERALFAQEVMR